MRPISSSLGISNFKISLYSGCTEYFFSSALQNFKNQWKESGEHDLCNLIALDSVPLKITLSCILVEGMSLIFLFIEWRILNCYYHLCVYLFFRTGNSSFQICDTDLKVERKFKTLFRGFVSQLYRSNILAFKIANTMQVSRRN